MGGIAAGGMAAGGVAAGGIAAGGVAAGGIAAGGVATGGVAAVGGSSGRDRCGGGARSHSARSSIWSPNHSTPWTQVRVHSSRYTAKILPTLLLLLQSSPNKQRFQPASQLLSACLANSSMAMSLGCACAFSCASGLGVESPVFQFHDDALPAPATGDRARRQPRFASSCR